MLTPRTYDVTSAQILMMALAIYIIMQIQHEPNGGIINPQTHHATQF
jgi:hypothetical protein